MRGRAGHRSRASNELLLTCDGGRALVFLESTDPITRRRSVRITPSARILRMLGEIQFAEWQCIAELVDNAFDDFADVMAEGLPWAGGFKVSVSLPEPSANVRDAEVVIRDTGRGMTRGHLEQAVRAGWSSNDQFDKLGLFGMGFNVSTARLGRKTRVLTTRAGDAEWIGVEIDLDKIQDDFEAPDITAPKDDPAEHGTRIEISKLDPDRASWLTRNAPALRRQLGHVYSWLLSNWPYELSVRGVRVKPRKPCRWGDDRYVIYGSGQRAEQIPAYIPIDETYEPAETCLVCGNWQRPGLAQCEQCDSGALRLRERRMHGWLGVQRYIDKTEFGIDFLRNGRKIMLSDKRLFEWSNPNDPTAAVLMEYPVELGQGGRLIGEIHLDHVPVNYQKNAFEFSDRGWLAAVTYLRGPGPLLPQKAKQLGYPPNDSPIGRLFKGYRRNDAGKRYLVPGDGGGPIHEKTREWARKFYEGDPDFQTDDMWWRAVVAHEQLKDAPATTTPDNRPTGHPDERAVLDALGITANGEPAAPAAPATPQRTPETEQQRLARYEADGEMMPELCGDFGHPDLGFFKLNTRLLPDGPLLDANAKPTPAYVTPAAGGTALGFVDASHPLFTRFGWDHADALLVELGIILKARADSQLTPTQIAALVKIACLPDSALDLDTVSAQARELLSEVRQGMADAVVGDPAKAFQWLEADQAIQTENGMIADDARGTEPLGKDSRFVIYAPALYLVRLLEEWPEAFLDGAVFSEPYSTLGSASARRLALSKVTSLLSDVAELAYQTHPGTRRLQRARLSVLLLADELTTAT